MGSAVVVHLFVSLQGRPPDLDAENEGAASPDRSSLVAHTPEGGGVCGRGSALRLLVGASAQSQCGERRCSLDW
jgi:hypothetical protein